MALQPPLGQADLDQLTGNFAALTLEVPSSLFYGVGALTGGWIFPVQITLSSVALILGPPAPAGSLSLRLTGSMQVSHFNVWTDNYPVVFTEFLSFAPSGDPVDTLHILSASYASPGISMPGPFGYAIKLLAPFIAGAITPVVETMVNQVIPGQVNAALFKLDPPQQLSSTAVVSVNTILITNSGIAVTATVADVFGPPLVTAPTTNVPDVVGDTVAKAETAITAAQLKMKVLYDSAATGDLIIEPMVEFQDPDPGQLVLVGSEVVVTVEAHGKPH